MTQKVTHLQLTIDDGPDPVSGGLDSILKTVADLKVKAAFFVLGGEARSNRSALTSIAKAGHVLGNHSWDHMEKGTSKYSDQQVYDQFLQCHEEVGNAGFTMQYWRAPRIEQPGRIKKIIVDGKNGKATYKPIYALSHCDMQGDSLDWQGTKTAAQLVAQIEKSLAEQAGHVITHPDGTQSQRLLFHVKRNTAKQLSEVITTLEGKGYTYVDFFQGS